MKKARTLLPPALAVALVVWLSGCTVLDYGIVTVEPSVVHMGEQFHYYYSFKSFELTTVTVSSIDWECYHDGQLYGSGTRDSGDTGWQTGTVPPFQEVVIYDSGYGLPVDTGSWEHRVVFHTSEGDFSAKGGWTVLP